MSLKNHPLKGSSGDKKCLIYGTAPNNRFGTFVLKNIEKKERTGDLKKEHFDENACQFDFFHLNVKMFFYFIKFLFSLFFH